MAASRGSSSGSSPGFGADGTDPTDGLGAPDDPEASERQNFPVAVHRRLREGQQRTGQHWLPDGDQALADELMRSGQHFESSPGMQRGIFALRRLEHRWAMMRLTIEPPRRDLVLQAVAVAPELLWRWVVPIGRKLAGSDDQILDHRATVEIERVFNEDRQTSLSQVLGLLSIGTRLEAERRPVVLALADAQQPAPHLDVLLRVAAAAVIALEPGGNALVWTAPTNAAEISEFARLGRSDVCIAPVVAPSHAGSAVICPRRPRQPDVRGIPLDEVLQRTDDTIDRLFDRWPTPSNAAAVAAWERSIFVPPVLIPADRLDDAEWRRRCSEHRLASDPAALRRDLETLLRSIDRLGSSTVASRCIDLLDIEADIGALPRVVRDQLIKRVAGRAAGPLEEVHGR